MPKNIFGYEQAMPEYNQPLESETLPDVYGIGSGGYIQHPNYGYQEEESPAMDALFQHVMSPPVRRGPSGLRMVGTGLLSALQDSTGPKSRVPLYNEKGKVVGSREAGFWESLGNNPFDYDEAQHILEDPYKKEVADWQLRTNSLKDAANIEKTAQSNAALAEYRRAQATNVPRATAVREHEADTKRMTAESQARVRALQTMTDAEKLKAVQSGQYTIEELKQAGATQRNDASIAGRQEVVNTQQTGATERNDATLASRESVAAGNRDAAMERALKIIEGQNNRTAQSGAQIGTVPGPDGKPMGVWYNPRTQQVEPINMGGQSGVPITPSRATGKTPTGESPEEFKRMEALRTRTTETLQELNSMFDDKGQLTPEMQSIVGGSRWFSGQKRRIPGQPEVLAEASLNRLKNMLVIDLIGDMKAQSKTGATGFGAMNLKELGVLEQAANKLDPNMGEQAFMNELGRIREKLNRILMASPTTVTVTGSPSVLTSEERIRRARQNRAQGGR